MVISKEIDRNSALISSQQKSFNLSFHETHASNSNTAFKNQTQCNPKLYNLILICWARMGVKQQVFAFYN